MYYTLKRTLKLNLITFPVDRTVNTDYPFRDSKVQKLDIT